MNVFANYVDDFYNTRTIGGVPTTETIDAWTTYDLNLNFDFDRGSWDFDPLNGARVSFNVNNVHG